MSTFHYTPLETPQTIRLVLVPQRAVNSQEKVHLKIHHCELPSISQKYNALSYTWGDSTKKHLVSLNGFDFWVADHLMFFLSRPQPFASRFWIDAMCLDQENGEEKSSQLPRMGEIYGQAYQVFADLGSASADQELVIDHIIFIARHLNEEAFRIRAENSGTFMVDKFICPFSEPYDPVVWARIGRFLNLSYWKRVWIMQESTAIANTKLWYGSRSCRYVDVMGLGVVLSIVLMKKPWGTDTPPELPSNNIIRLRDIRDLRGRGDKISLLEILPHFRDLEATDMRDIIYAALCLATDVSRGLVTPKPKKTLADVHLEVANFCIKNTLDPLDLLAESSRIFPDGLIARITVPGGKLAKRASRFQISFSFGSWVPQWYLKIPGLDLLPKHFISTNRTRSRIYDPWGQGDKRPLSLGSDHDQVKVVGSMLITDGLLLDQIHSVAQLPCASNDHTAARGMIESWVPSDPNGIYHPTGETRMTAFLRSIVLDLAKGKTPVTRGGAGMWDYNSGKLVVGDENDDEATRATKFCQWRTLAATKNGYMVLVFLEAQEGDVVFALRGGSMLYVLRPQGNDYIFIGECYVHGFMDGEALKLLEEGGLTMQEVRII